MKDESPNFGDASPERDDALAFAVVMRNGRVFWANASGSSFPANAPLLSHGGPPTLEPLARKIATKFRDAKVPGLDRTVKSWLRAAGLKGRIDGRCHLLLDGCGRPQGVLLRFQRTAHVTKTDRSQPPEEAVKRLSLAETLRILRHEIRTPLTSVHGFAELMLARRFDENKKRYFLRTIHQESLRLAGLLDRFIDLERIESGLMPARLVRTEFTSLVRTVCARRAEVGEIHVDLPSIPVWVKADPTLVSRLLSVLTAYVPSEREGGGKVTVAVTLGGPETAVASVALFGTVIAKGAIPTLFSKSYSPLQANWPRFDGFGLALAKAIVDAHQGGISVKGSPEATIFSFTLPLADRATQPQSRSSE